MFKAILLARDEARRTVAALADLDEAQLPAGDVDVRVEYSTLNYKDALAVTGRGAIVRAWPMVPGIDLAGIVEASRDAAWKPGDRVVVTGWGLGETHWGGLAQRARLRSHLDEVERLLDQGGEIGKRLDFLIQELQREANTFGSKSAALELSALAVEMKVAVEQLREQVQNIE